MNIIQRIFSKKKKDIQHNWLIDTDWDVTYLIIGFSTLHVFENQFIVKIRKKEKDKAKVFKGEGEGEGVEDCKQKALQIYYDNK